MERITIKVTTQKLANQQKDYHFWLTQPWTARLTALEQLRQQFYNYDDETTPRLQRVYSIIEQTRS